LDYHCFSGIDYAVDRDDIDFRNLSVLEELKEWGKWYLKEAPFCDIRLDAVKHMPTDFLAK
jgi:alpha-amylase